MLETTQKEVCKTHITFRYMWLGPNIMKRKIYCLHLFLAAHVIVLPNRQCGLLYRYELEEDPGVCDAMERTAQLFLGASADDRVDNSENDGPIITAGMGTSGGWARAGA
jgi:hypothetical protein